MRYRLLKSIPKQLVELYYFHFQFFPINKYYIY
nr:MAG TPA: hypothetical protein [Caudoviricetes sp.]